MESKTIYEVTLGDLERTNVEKKAKVLFINGRTTGPQPRNFSIVRLELRMFNGNSAGIGLSLTNIEFQWFINLLSLNLDHAKFTGKRILILDRILGGSVVLSSLENGKVYGLQFFHSEIRDLLANKDLFGFILQYYNASGSLLKKLTYCLFTVHIGEYVNKAIKSDCTGCNGIAEHSDQSLCNKYLRSIIPLKDYIKLVLEDQHIQTEFAFRFNSIASYLNITPQNKLETINITLPQMKIKEEITAEVTQYRDIGNSEANKLANLLQKIEPIMIQPSNQTTSIED